MKGLELTLEKDYNSYISIGEVTALMQIMKNILRKHIHAVKNLIELKFPKSQAKYNDSNFFFTVASISFILLKCNYYSVLNKGGARRSVVC
jgi:hypothetical protein